ncbi:MAG: M48 family metallopeptidase [Bacilli bacterium]|jgi:predicted metal-dependent hydrolase
MQFKIDNEVYEVIIEKKKNRNTYIRVKDDFTIYVTTNYLMNKNDLIKLLNNNISAIKKMINREKRKQVKYIDGYYLGKSYDIIILPQLREPTINGNKLFIDDKDNINKWYKKEANRIFNERLNYILDCFNENIPKPTLKIRKMKSRWGVCNQKKQQITLNLELIKHDIMTIDYVIVHELCHFIYPNHSRFFWTLVAKYIPNYKIIRKQMRDIV